MQGLILHIWFLQSRVGRQCSSIFILFSLKLWLFYSQSPYPCIIHGIKLFSFLPSSIPLFNQANGGNIYCIDLSCTSESTTIPNRAAISHFLFFPYFFLSFLSPSTCLFCYVSASTKANKKTNIYMAFVLKFTNLTPQLTDRLTFEWLSS